MKSSRRVQKKWGENNNLQTLDQALNPNGTKGSKKSGEFERLEKRGRRKEYQRNIV